MTLAKMAHIEQLKQLLHQHYIPFLGGRPDREDPITKDEIRDFKIDLWTTPSVDLFLEKIR